MSKTEIPTWAKKLVEAHLSVTDKVSHSERLSSDRYFVWQEDGYNALDAGNGQSERAVTGTTDLFTKKEFDPWAQELEASFDEAGICWELNSVQYEPTTGFYHYEWLWEVA